MTLPAAVLFDLDGHLLCTMDGAALTEARTPALSAVVIDRFARQGARTAAVLGTGREAVPHLQMLARTLDLLKATGAAGNLTADAQIASHALARDAVVATNDTDFLRFPGVRTHNPLV